LTDESIGIDFPPQIYARNRIAGQILALNIALR
jgi:hypothetical protein